jgi:hypothetical protein
VLKAGQWLPAKKNECPSVETGLIVRGDNAGTKRLVCCNGAYNSTSSLYSNTSASLTAFFRSCSDPRYLSVVRIDSCPSRN